ncbi:PAS domain S-box protein, partial [bacterium]|nr:PAS domain S-box protein [bacterium]
ELARLNERFELAQESAGVGIWDWDIPTSHIEWTRKMFELFGLEPGRSEASFDTWRSLLHPADLQEAEARITRALNDHVTLINEYRVVWPDGQVRWIHAVGHGIYDAAGEPLRMLGICTDITERKHLEEMLHRRTQEFMTLVENSPDAVTRFDLQGHYLYVNPARAAYFGLSPQEIVGKTWWDLLGPDEAEEGRIADQQFQKMLADPREYMVEYQTLTPRGLRWVQSREVPEFDQAGNLESVLVVSRDITERKEIDEAIRTYSERLEREVEVRTRELQETQEKLGRQEKLAVLGQLAGGVGHELRNPLSVITNAIYLLKLVQADASPKVNEYLGIIEQETHTAEQIISDLLEFSRTKSVSREPVIVKEILRQVLERFPAPENVTVKYKIPANLPTVFADPRHLLQVFGNLTVNACQAMPQGGTLTLSAKKKGKQVAIAVTDTGTGITPENMNKLFEPLFTTKSKGIGLGLAVSKKLAEANGGR